MTRREHILRATSEAAGILRRLPVDKRTSIDIVGLVTDLDIPLMFRPLGGLWGATISTGRDARGILVTTKLGRPVQRFTLAHELGHILLGHQMSFDKTVGFGGRLGSTTRPLDELAADTFASELLAPRALMLSNSKRHGWTKKALQDPQNVYQLSLRLGVSFQAACWGLAAQDVIPESRAKVLQDMTVKDLKLASVEESLLENSWADVWKLSAGDSGAFIEAGPEDIFAVQLEDDASSGYLWELVDPGNDSKVLDERVDNPPSYGASTSRVVFLRLQAPGVHRLLFNHRRPWNRQTIAHIDISVDTYGKETGGYARRVREQSLAAAEA